MRGSLTASLILTNQLSISSVYCKIPAFAFKELKHLLDNLSKFAYCDYV